MINSEHLRLMNKNRKESYIEAAIYYAEKYVNKEVLLFIEEKVLEAFLAYKTTVVILTKDDLFKDLNLDLLVEYLRYLGYTATLSEKKSFISISWGLKD